MGKMVLPSVYFVGHTTIIREELERYLVESDNLPFLGHMLAAREQGLTDGEILTSFYAKLCYASLVVGTNKNVKRVREIPDNLIGCMNAAHTSVFRHCQLNFVVRNCSRVFTHELVRHGAGTAFSQTSGRYVRRDSLDMVNDPILARYGILSIEEADQVGEYLEELMVKMGSRIEAHEGSFDLKKQLTSAMRRWLPNGQANEIGFSCNLNALRHIVQMRTSRHSEWEIRHVFAELYHLVKVRYPLMFHGATETTWEGVVEVSGMRMQPYEKVEVSIG